MAMGLLVSGCNGGGDGGAAPTAAATSGQALVSLTDAAGDFLAYTVDVHSLTLTKQNGTVVETLPLATRVNFADYVEMTEFFTAATIPSGIYTSARMRLDFSTAEIQVEDASGNAVAVPAGNIHDANGNPVTTLDMDVQFDHRRALVVAPGIPAHLTLDFNLQASNTADLTGPAPVITVKPFLVADVDPEQPKTMRMRGPLTSVNQANQTYQVFLRPVHRKLGDFGSVVVHTDTETVFEIDEVTYQGAAGLAALEAKPAATATVAIGQWKIGTRQFKADEVLAGTSVAGGDRDVVVGDVIARSGDLLTVRGASLLRKDGTFTFRDTLTVTMAAGTKIRRQALITAGLTKDDVSVGQRIAAFGSLDPGTNSLDATAGLVRMLMTSVAGTVNLTGAGSLEMNVQRIDGRRIALFNFAGTGAAAGTNADPTHYEVATGALSLAGLSGGTPVRVLGFATTFGTAAPDFTAQTVINLMDRPATMLVNWIAPTNVPFVSTDPSLVLNLAGAGTLHHVVRGPVSTDLLSFGVSPTVTPEHADQGLFALGVGGKVTVFMQYQSYRAAIEQQLSQGGHASVVGAHGIFSDAAVTVTADQVYTVLQ